MAKFENLKYDVTKLLQGDHSSEHLELSTATAKSIVTLAKNVATHTLDMVDHRPRPAKDMKDVSIRMSELGEPCHRKLMYKWYHPLLSLPPYAENPEAFLPVKFTFGDYIEELTLFLCNEAGHRVSCRQEEVRLDGTYSGWYAIGHLDAVIDDVVVDVKSAADASFNKYKREGLTEETDTFGYLWQLDAYATAKGTSKRAFIFTNKHDGNMHIIDRSDEVLLPVTSMINRIGSTADEYISTSALPPQFPTKPTKYGEQLGVVCSYCAFKYVCYDGNIKGVISSGRPAYYVENTLTKEGLALVKEKTTITKPEKYQDNEVPF
jgi:hypothetical protein